MTLSIIASALCLAVVLLMIADYLDKLRDGRAIDRRLRQENMRRRNEAADKAFRIQLHRERVFREYCHWDMNKEIES